MGELHLEVTIDRMRTELGVEADMGKPKVRFREAFGVKVDAHLHPKKAVRRFGSVRRSHNEIRAAGTGFGEKVLR